MNPALAPSSPARIIVSIRRVLPVLLPASAFLLYLVTMPPSITWQSGGQDSGNLAIAVQTLGIPHPTGYPTYVLLGKLFSYLPSGDLAHRLNLMSAVFAAAAVYLVYLLILDFSREWSSSALPWQMVGAATGALTMAVSPLFWSQAIIVEVYSLNAFFFTAVLWLLVRWRQASTGGHTYLWLAGLLLGAGLGNHITLLALLPAGIAVILPRLRELRFSPKHVLPAVLFCLAGLGVYLLLPLRAAAGPYANWGDPRTLESFVWLVSGGEYRYLLHSLSLAQIGSRLAGVVGLVFGEFGLWGLGLGLMGLIAGLQRSRWAIIGLGVSSALLAIYAASYAAENSSVYLLPAYIVWVLWVGQGIVWFLRYLGTSAQPAVKSMAPIACALLLLSPAAFGGWNYRGQDLHADRTALDYATQSLSLAPANALILTRLDEHTFSLEYAQQVLGLRPDVAIIDTRLLEWDWYREQKGQLSPQLELSLPPGQQTADLQLLLSNNMANNPCLTTFYDPALLTDYQLVPRGELFEIKPH